MWIVQKRDNCFCIVQCVKKNLISVKPIHNIEFLLATHNSLSIYAFKKKYFAPNLQVYGKKN